MFKETQHGDQEGKMSESEERTKMVEMVLQLR